MSKKLDFYDPFYDYFPLRVYRGTSPYLTFVKPHAIIHIEGGGNMDAQERVRIIDLAEKWADYAMPRGLESEEAALTKRIENFDKAYKAIVKTVTE